MTEEQLIALIEKVKAGLSVERSNLDLKRRWWNLKSPDGVEEFLKDICSMANSQTGDGSIVIGLAEDGSIHHAPLPEDEANIQALHKDRIEPRVKIIITEHIFEGNTLSVITVPHSDQRPHILKKHHDWQNWIPIRFGSATITASRSDLDEMYQERYKNHTSDLHVRLYEEKLRWGKYAPYGGYCYLALLAIDNYTGGAPDYIMKATLHESNGGLWKTKYFLFEGLSLNQECYIGPHERKQGIQIYLSDMAPELSKQRRLAPRFDKQNMVVSVYARSGKQINIPVPVSAFSRR